jgi:hypothetical protein
MARENKENRRGNRMRGNLGELETIEGKPGELENEGKPIEGRVRENRETHEMLS